MSTKTNGELIEEARQFMYSNLVVGKGGYNRQIINSLIEALQQAEHPGKPTAPKIPNFEVKRITLAPGLDPLWGIVDNHLSRFAPFNGEEDARNTQRNFEDHTSNPERYEWYALPVEPPEPSKRHRQRVTDTLLKEISRVYRESWSSGGAPTTAVSEHFHRSHSTAARYVMLARQAGHLGLSDGSRGGELTEPPEAPGLPETPEVDADDSRLTRARSCLHCGAIVIPNTGNSPEAWHHWLTRSKRCPSKNDGEPRTLAMPI